MTHKQYALICACTLTLGILIFAIQKEYIIFNFGAAQHNAQSQIAATKKSIPLSYWHQDKWNTDTVLLLITDSIPDTMQRVLSRWLQLIYDEKIVKKPVTVQAVLLHYDNQELLVSFDRLPWNKENNTFEKWMIIEGMLKTIKAATPSVKKVRFLINHQPMADIHLDFTNAWPIEGFL